MEKIPKLYRYHYALVSLYSLPNLFGSLLGQADQRAQFVNALQVIE